MASAFQYHKNNKYSMQEVCEGQNCTSILKNVKISLILDSSPKNKEIINFDDFSKKSRIL